MIRVVLLATDLQRGGLPLRLARMAPWLQRLGLDPVVGSLAARGPLADELEACGVETFACEAAGPFDVNCLRRLAWHLRRLNPDIIHSSLFHANIAARLVGRLDRARAVITSTVTIEIERGWHRWGESLTAGMSDLHMVNSRAVADHVRDDLGFRDDQIVVIPNAIDLGYVQQIPAVRRGAHGIPEEAELVVWAGRMDPVKNLDVFVEVIGKIVRRRRVVAVLLGDGRERTRIESLVAQRGLEDVIRFVGWTEHVVAWLKAADALLFPSLTEGSPNVVLEAIAADCPVVAGDVPGCRELIADASLGRLCGPWDAGGLADALEGVLRLGLLGTSPAGTVRSELLARHEISRVARCWQGVYGRVLGGSYHRANFGCV